MTTLIEDIATYSEWISRALLSSGYRADFSPASLWEVERFCEENAADGKPRKFLAQDLGAKVFALGSYVGEVVRRNRGGEWHADDEDPQGEINVELRLSPDEVIWPVQRVMKRINNGPEENIAHYGSFLELEVGPQPDSPKRPWWRFW